MPDQIPFDAPKPDDLDGFYLEINAEDFKIDSYEEETPTRIRIGGRAFGREFVRRIEVE